MEPHLMSHALSYKRVASSHFGTMRYETSRQSLFDGKGMCGRVEGTSPRRTQQQATFPTSKQKQGSSPIYQRTKLLDECSTGIFRCKSIQPLCPEAQEVRC